MTLYPIDSSSPDPAQIQGDGENETRSWWWSGSVTRKYNLAMTDAAISFHTMLNTPSVHDACTSEGVCWGPWLLSAQRNPQIPTPPEALPKLTPVLGDRRPLSVVLNLLLQPDSSLPKDIQENGPTPSACTTGTYTHVTCSLYYQHWWKYTWNVITQYIKYNNRTKITTFYKNSKKLVKELGGSGCILSASQG